MRTIERTGQFKRDYKREAKGAHRTTLTADLTDILKTLANDHPQGHAVLLLSDGIHNAPGGVASLRQTLRSAKAMNVPVYTHTLGGDTRLKDLEKDPKTRWRVTDADWQRFKQYDRYVEVSEHALRTTSQGHAPWIVVAGKDPRYR